MSAFSLIFIERKFESAQLFLQSFSIPGYSNLNSSFLAFVLGSTSWLLINLIFQRNNEKSLAIEYAEKYGGPLAALLVKSLTETKPVSFTLRSGKVYIGFVTKLREKYRNEEYLLIWPQFSGYRETETKKLNITSNYFRLYEAVKQEDSGLSGIDPNDFQVLLPVSQIETVSIFDPQVYNFLTKSEI